MLTPQDVQNKEFAKAVFGGYDMSAVDNFLEIITEDYSSLFKENAILKSKIKVLVEKVEEYRSTEDSMRMALLTAQKMGDDLVEEANRKSAEIISNAENKFKTRMADIAREIAVEEARLKKAKLANEEFVKESAEIVKEHATFLAALETLEITEEPLKMEAAPPEEKALHNMDENERIDDAVKHIDEVMSKLIAGEEEQKEEKPGEGMSEDEDDDESLTPRPKFDFQDLQFGKNYSSGGN